MKILIVSNDYPSPNRPVYTFVEQLVNQFLQIGLDVVIVAPQSLTHAAVHQKALRPRKNIVLSPNSKKYKVYRPYYISAGDNYPKLTHYLNELKIRNVENIVKKEQPDVLYAHFWGNAELIDGIARKYKKPLFVACGEGDDALEMMIDRMPTKRKMEMANTVTGMISVSSENKRKCLAYGLCREDNVVVLPNCVDTIFFRSDKSLSMRSELGIKKDDFVVAFCGAFIERKGSKRLSIAIDSLNDDGIKSIFVGKSFEGEDCIPTCKGIVYKNSVKHDKLPTLLNTADIFVLPTRKEGCCNAIVEALACGLPVISSDGAFNDDILNDKNSIRVNPDDVEAIAKAIKTLKDNKVLCKQMHDYTISRHDDYSLNRRAMRILDFMESKSCTYHPHTQ